MEGCCKKIACVCLCVCVCVCLCVCVCHTVGGAVSSEAYSSELGQLLQLSLILALTPQEERGAQVSVCVSVAQETRTVRSPRRSAG